MGFPNRETVERVRREYPPETRVELVRMDDVQAPPIGTKGTVIGVDDTASILVHWDNGSHLNIVFGEDQCRKVVAVRTICYGETTEWNSRKEAEDFYFRAMTFSEGSELSRYTKIYMELIAGFELCTDGE